MNEIPWGRHGDLVLYRITVLPSWLREEPSGVVRRGSSDAADHVLAGGRTLVAEDGTVYVDAGPGASLTHSARHATVALPEGAYVVRRLVVATDAGAMPVED